MTKTQRLRMTIDITMTILSIILMGGNYLFPADIVHEILGVGLFFLWAIHIILNRRWYASLAQASKLITSTNANDRRSYRAIFRGKYNPYRIMQTVINCCILICTILLMISGIILSNHLFTFLNIQGGLGFARIAHLLASHWYYLFMSLHIGLHDGRDHGDVHGEGAFLPLAEPHDGGSQADVGGNAVCGGIAGNQQVFTKGVGGFFKIVCHVNSFKMVDDVIV